MEKRILKLFLFENKLKFSEIEKQSKINSNKLAYHLKKLINKKVLEKKEEYYELTETAEQLIPYLSEKTHPLPVILISIEDKKSEKVFLYRRQKRPYQNKLSLPGGRLLFDEEISQAVKRIMKEKHNISASLIKVNSVSLEHLIKNKKIIHSFLLIFVSAKTKEKIKLTNIEPNKKKIIPSDYFLIKNDSDKNIDVKTIISKK